MNGSSARVTASRMVSSSAAAHEVRDSSSSRFLTAGRPSLTLCSIATVTPSVTMTMRLITRIGTTAWRRPKWYPSRKSTNRSTWPTVYQRARGTTKRPASRSMVQGSLTGDRRSTIGDRNGLPLRSAHCWTAVETSGQKRLPPPSAGWRRESLYVEPVELDGDLEVGDLADLGPHGGVGADPAGREHPYGPLTRCGEEAEDAFVAGHDLAGELAGRVEQPCVRARDNGPLAFDGALDDRFVRQVHGGGQTRRLSGRPAAVRHFASPSSIGTPMSDPYSVHDPS